MRVCLLSAAILAATACVPPPSPGPTPAAPAEQPGVPAPPAPPPAAAGEVVQLGPSAVRYLVHRQMHTEQEFQGRTVAFDRGVRAFVSATITGPADSSGYPLALMIDSIVADSGTRLPPTINLAAVRRLRYTGRVTSVGALSNLLPSDSTLAWNTTQVFGSFQGFYPRLPPAGLTLGSEWVDTVTTLDRGVTTTYTHRSRGVGWEERDGARCMRLEVSSTFTLAGAGELSGRPMEVSGSGSRFTTQFVASDGRYLGGHARDSMAITRRFPDEGEFVPGHQISVITVTVLP